MAWNEIEGCDFYLFRKNSFTHTRPEQFVFILVDCQRIRSVFVDNPQGWIQTVHKRFFFPTVPSINRTNVSLVCHTELNNIFTTSEANESCWWDVDTYSGTRFLFISSCNDSKSFWSSSGNCFFWLSKCACSSSNNFTCSWILSFSCRITSTSSIRSLALFAMRMTSRDWLRFRMSDSNCMSRLGSWRCDRPNSTTWSFLPLISSRCFTKCS